MKSSAILSKETEIEDLIREIRQALLKFARLANKVIMDEVEFCGYLKISKHNALYLRSSRRITFSKPGG